MKKLLCVLFAVLCAVLSGCSRLPAVFTDDSSTNADASADRSATAFISEARALELASNHWNVKSGDRDPNNRFLLAIQLFDTPTAKSPQYRADLRWLVGEGDTAAHWSTVDTIWIDAVTEEITAEPVV